MSPSPTSPDAAASHAVHDAARMGDAGTDLPTLLRVRRQLNQALQNDHRPAAWEGLARALQSAGPWDFLALVVLNEAGPSARLEGLAAPANGLNRELHEQLIAAGRQAITEQRTTTQRAQDPAGWIVTAPCPPVRGGGDMALTALSAQAGALKPGRQLLLECAAGEIAQAETRRRLAASESDLLRTAAVVELMERLSQCSRPDQLNQRLVQELARVIGRVTILLGRCRRGGGCRIVASAGDVVAPSAAQDRETLAGVMDEVHLRQRMSRWPADSATAEAGWLLHRQYVDANPGRWLVGLPLPEADESGCVLLVVGTDPAGPESAARFLAACASPLVAVRRTVHLAQLGPLTRWRRGIAQVFGRKPVRCWGVIAALSLAALAIPIPHRVECECDLEPVLRQFVAAPFEAPLEAVLVRPGDEVRAEQLLARLDGRELRWELAGVTAEYQRASRERDGHMAKHDSGAARLAELEMERLQLKLRLLEHRTTQLEVCSPVAGLVISGDLDKAIGAPLDVGQVLFELAPLEQLVAEVQVPERDVPYTRIGQRVEFWLDSQPDEPLTGTIARLMPRAEIQSGESVFVAEVAVENRAGWLRPGMHGTARIDVGRCRLGWRLFHRAWETARVWAGM